MSSGSLPLLLESKLTSRPCLMRLRRKTTQIDVLVNYFSYYYSYILTFAYLALEYFSEHTVGLDNRILLLTVARFRIGRP